MLKIKSVYDSIKKEDGLRILATRFKGMFLKKTRYNLWMANLGPSGELLKSFQADKISWPVFQEKYKEEILNSLDLDRKNKVILNHGQKFTLRLIKFLAKGQNVTLMCHCDTGEEMCHLKVLEKILQSKII